MTAFVRCEVLQDEQTLQAYWSLRRLRLESGVSTCSVRITASKCDGADGVNENDALEAVVEEISDDIVMCSMLNTA